MLFVANIRKMGIPVHSPFFYVNVSYKGVFIVHGHAILIGKILSLGNMVFFYMTSS